MTRLAGLALVLAVGSACAPILGGNTKYHAAPRTMAAGDLGEACASGEALASTLSGFAKGGNAVSEAMVSVAQSSAMCVDPVVWDAELAYLRAIRAGDVAAAKDALAVSQRAHALAGQRSWQVWKWLERGYGLPETAEDGTVTACPKLPKGHDGMDELIYLLGLSAGVTAVLHDNASGGQVGVPMSIPATVVRASSCFDDARWWGVPTAMRASVMALMPDAPGVTENPWVTMDKAFAKGDEAAVRLASAFRAQTAAALDKPELVRKAIREHAASLAARPADARWTLLDRHATAIVRHESDKIWTSLVGHRTPSGALGTFPDDAAPAEDVLDLDVFDGLVE